MFPRLNHGFWVLRAVVGSQLLLFASERFFIVGDTSVLRQLATMAAQPWLNRGP